MQKMTDEIWKAIETYQIPGCVNEAPERDTVLQEGLGVEWSEHVPGTIVMPNIGTVFLGMPKGFNRLGICDGNSRIGMKINIFENLEQAEGKAGFDWLNVPVWKYLDNNGNTLVRGLRPRRNEPFLYVILEDCMDKINCYEVTKENIDFID
jgi:hypothetical protein